MSQLVALSVSIGILGAVATYLYLTVGLLIWAGFIAWACYFHSGADGSALKNTIVCNAFGAFCAWVAALIILSAPSGTLWAAIIVGLTVLAMCLGSQIKAFALIPASVYGYATIFAYLLQTPETMAKEKLMSAGLANALILVIISMALGALFGWASGKMAAAIGPKTA